jgi:hypothetical protein
MSLIAELGQQMYIKLDAVSIVEYKSIYNFQTCKLNMKNISCSLQYVFINYG